MEQNQLIQELAGAFDAASRALVPALKAILNALAIALDIVAKLIRQGLTRF